jgi:hypothetical protein
VQPTSLVQSSTISIALEELPVDIWLWGLEEALEAESMDFNCLYSTQCRALADWKEILFDFARATIDVDQASLNRFRRYNARISFKIECPYIC